VPSRVGESPRHTGHAGSAGGVRDRGTKIRQARGVGGETTTVEPQRGWLRVVQHGRLADLGEARALQQRVEAACARHGCRRLLFDNRDTEAPDDPVRDSMFAWAITLERVAILLRSELKAVRANMDAVSRRAHVRAFVDEAVAAAWLSE
jgi:hypothetical protein